MKKERIYSLTLDVKDPDLPFTIKYSGSVQSGSLTEVLARFPLELNKILKQIAEDDRLKAIEDDIPF